MTAFQRIWGYIWLNDKTWTEEERQEYSLVRRLDFVFLPYLALSAVVKYLDQNNISNAYVSGMKEDLHLFGNQLNYFTIYFNIGYIIIIPISTYIINGRVRPSIWLPTAELIWGIATAGMSAVKNYQQVYGLRFLVGFAEGTSWPGAMTLLLSWYTPAEIGKRIAIFQTATYLGGIFAGALQAALYTNLNGAHGLEGWRWLFVVNAVITVVIAGFGYFACPDYSNKVNPLARWLRPIDIEVANRRMKAERREMPTGWSLDIIKKTLSDPLILSIWLLYSLMGQAITGIGYFNLWLKSLKNANGTNRYSVYQLNTIPIASSCISMVTMWTLLSISDRIRLRWPFLLFLSLVGITFSSVLVKWTGVSDSAKFASYLLLNITGPNATFIIAWLGSLLSSAEQRTFVVGACVTTYYIISAACSVRIWPAAQAPHYKIGWNYALACHIASLPVLLLVLHFERRRRRTQDDQQECTSDSPGNEEASFEEKHTLSEANSPGVERDATTIILKGQAALH